MSEREVSNFVDIDIERSASRETTRQATALMLTMHRLALWVSSPRPYLMLIGFALFLGFWYFAVEVWKLPRFARDARADRGGQGVVQQGSDLRNCRSSPRNTTFISG